MKRDHTQLICDIGELTAACHESPCLEDFLQRSAELIADHMDSEVCSIYLYFDESRELVLKATKGLNPSAVGRVKLKLGEGLTGLALKELRPICEREASKREGYRYFSEIGEEKYDSFLAVPILHGQNRIGAIVVQNSQSHYFTPEDINTLRAITAQLAATIETVKILMAIDKREDQQRDSDLDGESPVLGFLKGRSGAPGIVIGQAAIMTSRAQLFQQNFIADGGQGKLTRKDFDNAVNQTLQDLETLQDDVAQKLPDVASLIFTAHILMLKDKVFLDAIGGLIDAGLPAPQAVKQVVLQYVLKFESLDSPVMREKAQDVRDVGTRILEHLVGGLAQEHDYNDRIVIAGDLMPSDMLSLSSAGVKGLILLSGGITSHVAILARSLEIPLAFIEEPRLLHVTRQQTVILDADNGNIYIDPDNDVLASFDDKQKGAVNLDAIAKSVLPETVTADGTRVRLLANINLLCDLKAARSFKAEGIGLYRTEFPFMVRADFPTEEEQFRVYQKLVQDSPDGEIVVRTLDIGGDKVLSYYDYGKQNNPFLGMRSIRFSLRHKDIFYAQLRAILRAGKGADLKIMFPMISSVDEFLESKQAVLECIRELKQDGVTCHANPQIGMMVELPSVVEIIDELAHEADFFSIGTNDFIQYMLAIDRTNEKVADMYLPHHPSVLRSLKRVVQAAQNAKIDVSICGDMSYDERYLPYFLGIGLRRFSVDPHMIPRIQQALINIDLTTAQAQTERLLASQTIRDVEEILIRKD